MIPWQQFPYVRILLFYVLGVVLNSSFNIEVPVSLSIFLITGILLLLLGIGLKFLSHKFRIITGLYLGLGLMLIGIFNSQQYHLKNNQIPISGHQGYFLLVNRQPIETEKSMKVIGQVYSQTKDQRVFSDKVILYFAKDSSSLQLSYGDFLKFSARLNPLKSPQNPHEFNYKKYLENRRIYHQAFLKSGSWMKLDSNRADPIKKFAIDLRQHLLKTLKKANFSQTEFAVTAAILLGQDDILDDETRQDYAGAGALHVLCVSGLHVGIIFLAFNLMFGFLKKTGLQKTLKTGLLLLAICAYALITGFSPSVLRASVMLSFIILGSSLNKQGNIYNSIAASAFLLLLINPAMMMEVGFQLSYAAVIGIISIYPLLKNHIHHQNKIVDKILSILIVSVAAQIGTFPLAIYYFHQFPVYFLLTNLVVILLATLIINLGFAFLLFSWIPVLSTFLQYFFGKLVESMNAFVSWIESLPGSTLKSLVIYPLEILIIYLLVISLTQTFLNKSKSWFTSSIILVLAFGVCFSYRNYTHFKQTNFIVYHLAGQSVFEFKNGKENCVFMDSTLMVDDKKVNYHLVPNWIQSGIKNPNLILNSKEKHLNSKLGLSKNGKLFFFQNSTFLRITNKNLMLIKNLKAGIDYVIISENAPVSMAEIYAHFHPKLIILDSSNSFYFEKNVLEDVSNDRIPFYSVLQEGAFTLSLD